MIHRREPRPGILHPAYPSGRSPGDRFKNIRWGNDVTPSKRPCTRRGSDPSASRPSRKISRASSASVVSRITGAFAYMSSDLEGACRLQARQEDHGFSSPQSGKSGELSPTGTRECEVAMMRSVIWSEGSVKSIQSTSVLGVMMPRTRRSPRRSTPVIIRRSPLSSTPADSASATRCLDLVLGDGCSVAVCFGEKAVGTPPWLKRRGDHDRRGGNTRKCRH